MKEFLLVIINDIVIDLEVAKYIVKTRLEYQEGNKYCVILFGSKLKNITREARDYFSKKGNENIISLAVIMTNTLGKTFVNFYLRVNKPDTPTKLFSNKNDATIWSKEQLHLFNYSLKQKSSKHLYH